MMIMMIVKPSLKKQHCTKGIPPSGMTAKRHSKRIKIIFLDTDQNNVKYLIYLHNDSCDIF